MPFRTDRSTVSFMNPFSLKELESIQPAGSYLVETDFEVIEGISRLAYRRVATLLTIPCLSAPQSLSQRVYIEQSDLDAALMKDQQTGEDQDQGVTNTGNDDEH